MKRGEQGSIAVAVLSIIGVVGVLATLTLIMRQPSGQITQDSSVYQTVQIGSLNIMCQNMMQEVYFLGYQGAYEVYCCPEHMIGQNECKHPKKILIRT